MLTGIGLPDDGLHSPNEKLDLAQLWSGIQIFGRFFELLGQRGDGPSEERTGERRDRGGGAGVAQSSGGSVGSRYAPEYRRLGPRVQLIHPDERARRGDDPATTSSAQ